MSFGITIVNDSNELTFSESGTLYSFGGLATFQSIVQADGYSGVFSSYNGYSTYTFEYAGHILVALPVDANGGTSLLSKTRSGNTWTIKVYKGNGFIDGNTGFENQVQTNVYVFLRPISLNERWGISIYDAQGNLSGDLSRKPLVYAGILQTAGANNGDVSDMPTPYMQVPLVIGSLGGGRVTSAKSTTYVGRWITRRYAKVWKVNSSNGLFFAANGLMTYQIEDGQIPSSDYGFAAAGIAINGAIYS